MQNKLNHGFTLLEIIVIVVILSILTAIIIPQIINRPDTAKLSQAKQDIQTIETALNLYKLDNFHYPPTKKGLEILVPTYLNPLPKDPWGNTYFYLSPGEHSAVDVFSYGASGKKTGNNTNADLNNWTTE